MRRLLVALLCLLPSVVGAQIGPPYISYSSPGGSGVSGGAAAGATFTVAASDSTNVTGADYVCDGTNDEVQIAAAIAAIPAAGGRVLLLDGTYNVAAPIAMQENLWLQGQGPGTVIKVVVASWNVANNYLFYDGAAHANSPQSNITISDLTIDLDGYNGGGSDYLSPIVFWGFSAVAENNRVERCHIRDGLGYGVLLINNTGFSASGNTISNMGDSCFEIRSTRGAVMSGNTLSTCSLQTYADHAGAVATSGIVYDGNDLTNVGVYVADPTTGEQVNGYVFSNNTWKIVGDVKVNLWFNSTKNLLVQGNVFDTTLSTHASLNPIIHLPASTATAVRISDNILTLGTDTGAGVTCRGGVLVEGASDVVIDGNHIRCPGSTTAYAVKASSGIGLVIRGNTFIGGGTGASTVGVDLTAHTTFVLVENNRFDTWLNGLALGTTTKMRNNTFDSVTNYQGMSQWHNGSGTYISVEKGGSGAAVPLYLSAAGSWIELGVNTYVRDVLPLSSDTYALGSASYLYTQANVSRVIQGGKARALTESSATTFTRVSVAQTAGANYGGGTEGYTVYATDGTDSQSLQGDVRFAVVNKAGTETCTVGEVGTPVLAESAGASTLTCTFTCTTATADSVDLYANCVSSLAQTTFTITHRADMPKTNAYAPQ